MAWTYSCCWTDHSNGCPEEDISRGGCPNSAEWYRAWRAIRVKRGYDQPVTPEKLDEDVARFNAYLLEERMRFPRKARS